MSPFKIFIAPQVDVPPAVVTQAGNRLKTYFDRIIQAMAKRVFSPSTVRVSPHSSEVGAQDLLVYLTQASLIVNMFNKVYEPEIPDHQLPGSPGGGTKKMPNGAVLSEVFWTGGLMGLPKDVQGTALGNLIFHEFAHNKHSSDPVALRNGEEPNGDFVHFSCGGGVLQRGVTIGLAARLDINTQNISSLARVLDSGNRQDTCGLFSDELGF